MGASLDRDITLEYVEFGLKMRKNILIPLIWLLIYPVIIPVPLSNYVLCIGVDGHVEFEAGADGRCVDVLSSHSEQTEVVFTEATAQADHCGSCIDLPIFFSPDEQTYLVPSKKNQVNQPISSVALTAVQSHLSITINPPPLVGSTPSNYPPLVSLRTTPLLI